MTRWTTGLLLKPTPAPEMRRFEIATPWGSRMSYFIRPVSSGSAKSSFRRDAVSRRAPRGREGTSTLTGSME